MVSGPLNKLNLSSHEALEVVMYASENKENLKGLNENERKAIDKICQYVASERFDLGEDGPTVEWGNTTVASIYERLRTVQSGAPERGMVRKLFHKMRPETIKKDLQNREGRIGIDQLKSDVTRAMRSQQSAIETLFRDGELFEAIEKLDLEHPKDAALKFLEFIVGEGQERLPEFNKRALDRINNQENPKNEDIAQLLRQAINLIERQGAQLPEDSKLRTLHQRLGQ